MVKKQIEKNKMKKVEKRAKRGSRSANFIKLRNDLFRKATNLVSEAPSSKIAILFNRPGSSSESDVSAFSFGYPSADDVVKTFLRDSKRLFCKNIKDSKRPDAVPVDADKDEEEDDDAEEEDQSSEEFWWKDPKLLESKDPEEVKARIDGLKKTLEMLKDLKELHNENAEPKP